MKKLFLFGLVFTLFISCSDEMEDSTKVEQANWKNFSDANVSSAKFIYEYMQDNAPANGRISEEATTELIIEATDEYLKSEGISDEDRRDASVYLEGMLTADEEPYYNGEVTEMQVSFIAALELVFLQEADFETTISYIESLEQQAYDLLSDEEIGLVLMATTTAKSQSSFWYNNLEGSSSNGRVMCVRSWRSVGRKAVAGAFGGAAFCGAARLFGPIGWKAWGTCIVGGAAAGGVQEIVEQCMTRPQLALTPEQKYQNCVRNSGFRYNSIKSFSACGGSFLNYNKWVYGRNPYQLIKNPNIRFP